MIIVYNSSANKMNVNLKENFIPNLVENPHVALIELLKIKGLTVSTAESFTGGNIASKLTSVSGASAVFYEGIVAYNERAKEQRLGVNKQTLEVFKPVSKETAFEMAKGLASKGNCDLAISTTGIAGPNSDDSNFPVGLCFIGINFKGDITVYGYKLNGNRQEIVNQGTNLAINLAINTIKNI